MHHKNLYTKQPYILYYPLPDNLSYLLVQMQADF